MPRPLSAYQRAVKQKRRVRRGRSPKEQSEAEPRSMRQHAKGVMRFFVGESVKHQIPNPSRPPPPSRSTATASAQAGQSNNTENARPSIPPKTQNGLRNQFHLSPYKPLTAQCESAPPLSKTNHTPKRNSQTTQANSPNALSQAADASCSRLSRVARQKGVLTAQNFVSRPLPRLSRQQQKTRKSPRLPTQKPKKTTRANTPHIIFITSHTNLTINEKPYRKNTDTQPVSRIQN